MFPRSRGRNTRLCMMCLLGVCLYTFFYLDKSTEKGIGLDSHRNEVTMLDARMWNLTSYWPENSVNISEKDFKFSPMLNLSQSIELEQTLLSQKLVSHGYQRNETAFLTMGIPTVKRKSGCEYLLRTLDSIIMETSADDQKRIVIVVFLADEDQHYNSVVTSVVSRYFKPYLMSGFIRILEAPADYYPDFAHLKQNFGDTEARVRWRSKQVLDYAYMFHYCANISEYYMQLEDDVLPVPEYVNKIEEFIKKNSKRHWVELDFSSMGYIGKLYKQKDLQKLSKFLMIFYEEQPVDWLNGYFRNVLAQKKSIVCKPSVFNHIGLQSSYTKNIKRKVSERATFQFLLQNRNNCLPLQEQSNALRKDVNVFSSIRAYKPQFTAESCYNSTGDYFWAVDAKQNDTLSVIYTKDKNITSITVETGTLSRPKDILHEGSVFASTGQDGTVTIECNNMVEICRFKQGKCTYAGDILKNIRCISVKVRKTQKTWIIFSQFRVLFQ